MPFAAQAQSIPDEPVGLEIAYGMSFYDFDFCGDDEAGRIFRRLIIAKIQACSYSQAAREKFQANIANNTEDLLTRLLKARSEGQLDKLNGPPEVQQGMSCKEYRQSPSYREKRTRLLRYEQGEIGIDEVLGDSGCPSGPASL